MPQGLEADIAALGQGSSIADLVEKQEPFLVSEQEVDRKAAVHYLAEISERCPISCLSAAITSTLVSFFADKLADRSCIPEATQGCKTIFHRVSAETSSQPTLSALLSLEQSILRQLIAGGLAQDNRRCCLQLLYALVEEYGPQLLESKMKLLDDVVAAIGEERDPRCLLIAFELVKRVVNLYAANAPLSLQEQAEDVCDAIIRYFPVTFRLPPNSEHGITRNDLAAALQATLCCTPLFAPFVVPVALDKLSSSVWMAKLDALSCLAACAESWGFQPLAPQVTRIWWALKEEIAEPLEIEAPPEDRQEVKFWDSGMAASACLRRCLAAEFSHSSPNLEQTIPSQQCLLDQALDDEHIADLLQWIIESSSAGESVTMAQRISISNVILETVAASSPRASSAIFDKLFIRLMSHVDSGDLIPVSLALSSALALLKGAAEGVTAWRSSSFDGCISGLSSLCCDLLRKLLTFETKAPKSAADVKVALLSLRIIAQLSAFLREGPQVLKQEEQEAAARKLLEVTTGALPEFAHEAAIGLSQIAGRSLSAEAGHNRLLEETVLPGLFESLAAAAVVDGDQALIEADRTGSTPESSDPVLRCLVGLHKASQELAAPVASGLTKVVLQILRESDSMQRRPQEACKLQALADSIFSGQFDAKQAAAASSFVLDLLAVMTGWQQENVGKVVLLAASLAVRAATAGCDVVNQRQLVQAAAAKLVPATEASAVPMKSAASWLALAAVVALRPGVGIGEEHFSSLQLLEHILLFALEPNSSIPDSLQQLPMAAAASLLLKWPPGGDDMVESVDEAVALTLEEVVLPRLQLQLGSEERQGRLRAVKMLGWVAKALAMRPHALAAQPLRTAAAYLEAASLDWASAEEERENRGQDPDGESSAAAEEEEEVASEGPEGKWEEEFDAEETRAMAHVFATLLRPGEGVACLDESVHATGGILWQQKSFTEALNGLVEKLEAGQEFLGRPAAPLLMALAHLMGGCPTAILASSWARLIPWTLAALRELPQGLLVDADALFHALSAVHTALEDERGRQCFEGHGGALVSVLLLNIGCQTSPAAKQAALKCLASALKLPVTETRIRSRKPEVLRALDEAVDDQKRAVRMQAAETRGLWMLI